MNLNTLFPKQAELDKYIYQKNNVTAEQVFKRKIVAFEVNYDRQQNGY